ncbi:MAG: hypothetical protein ISQ49_01695 [Synechococcus sp. BS307-5m-G35]|nr:hypothetical protein [Synechococcus sp. BS307-5m-G35]
MNELVDYLTSPTVAASFLIVTFCAAVELGFSREGLTCFIDDCWIAASRDDQTMSAHAAAKIGQHFGDELTFFKAFTRCWGQPNQAEAKKEN